MIQVASWKIHWQKAILEGMTKPKIEKKGLVWRDLGGIIDKIW